MSEKTSKDNESNTTSGNKPTEEVDIYSDILTDQDEQITKLEQKVKKISSEKALLIKSLTNQQKQFDDLQRNYQELLIKYKTVSFNSSSLFKTAQAEIKRKDHIIQDLRREVDNLVFRKNPASQAIGRARKIVADVEKKNRSPLKKNEPVGPGPPSLDAAESKSSKITVGLESEEKQKKDESIVVPKTTVGLESQEKQNKDECIMVPKTTVGIESEKKQSKDEVIVVPKNNSFVAPKSSTSSTNVIPPLLQGPITEYSKRMYKRVYGVCPLQVESNSIDPKSDANNDREFMSSKDNNSKEQNVDQETILNVTKSPRVVSKLQEKVKEFIKLGTNSVSQSSLNKSPPENNAEISPVSINIEKPNITNNETGSTQHLVIYCDGNENISKGKMNSPNINVNETINNILQNHKNGMYSSSNQSIEVSPRFTKSQTYKGDSLNFKDKTINKEKCTASLGKKDINLNVKGDREVNDLGSKKTKLLDESNKRKPNRLLENLNKRIVNKPVISPVTFGKLVSPEISKSQKSDIIPLNKINKGESSAQKDPAEKSQRSNEVISCVKSSICLETSPSHFQVEKKKHCITSLFGESPLKSIGAVEVTVKEKDNVENLGSPLLQNATINPDSSVLPSSPTLDSDDPGDLVIDTTACSRNTSPRVSESYEIEEDNAGRRSLISYKDSLLRCAIKKQNLCSETSSIEKSLGDITKSVATNTVVLPPKTVDPSNKLAVNGLSVNDIHKNSHKDNFCLPDLSECFTLESKNKPEIEPKCSVGLEQAMESTENDSSKLAATLESETGPNETNTDLCGYLSHSSSSEVNSGNNSSNYKPGENSVPNIKRFIPSPTQLSLVSALRHSENSVFNIAEDTAGFVSALTRVRDISPIRTPDKKNKPLTVSDSQLKTPEVNDGGQDVRNNLDLSNPREMNSIPVVSFQSVPPLETNVLDAKISTESPTQSVDAQSANVARNQFSNVQSNLFDKLKNTEFAWNELEGGMFTNLNSSSTEEKNDNGISAKSKPYEKSTSNDTRNVFKRSRPVRRIVLPNQTKRLSSEKCNKENVGTRSQSNGCIDTTDAKPPVGTCITTKESEPGHVLCKNIVLSNVEEVNTVSTLQPAISKMRETNQTEVLTGVANDIEIVSAELSSDSINKTSVLEVSSSSNKVVITSPGNLEEKVFKRSVSLRTMPKPKPKINYDILNRPEIKEDKCSKQKHTGAIELIENQKDDEEKLKNVKHKIASKNKSFNNDGEIKYSLRSNVNFKKCNRPIILIDSLSVSKKNVQENTEKKELEQSPHIANINKRTRVSSFQRTQINVKQINESKYLMKGMGKPCLKENNIINDSTLSVTGNCSIPSCKVSQKVSCKLKYPSKLKKGSKTNVNRKKEDITMCKSLEQETSSLTTKSCKIKEIKNPESACLSKPRSQTCKSQSKSPSPDKNSTFETSSKSLNKNLQEQTTQNKRTDRKKMDKSNKITDKPKSKVENKINTSLDNSELLPANYSEQTARSTSNERRSSSNISEGNAHLELRRSESSSPEARSRSKQVKHHYRTDSKSPQPRVKSKSCLQPMILQSESPETIERSKSQHLKKSVPVGAGLKSDDIHHKRSCSMSPESKPGGYHVQKHPRSRSRESRHPRYLEHSSRSSHHTFYKRHSHKDYFKRSRSRSPHFKNRYKGSRDTKEHYFNRSSGRSPYFSRKRKSRSLSRESMDHCNKSKKLKQANRNSTNQKHSQSPSRIMVNNCNQTPKKSENPADNQLSLNKLDKLENKFGFLTNQVLQRVSQADDHSSQKQKTLSFLEEIEQIKKEMDSLKSQLKNVNSPSKDNKIVSKAKSDFEIHPKSKCDRVINRVSQSSFSKTNQLDTSSCRDDPSCSPNLYVQNPVQEIPKNDDVVLPKPVSVLPKPICVVKYVKRRSRNLGDSDVTVVSSSTKLSKNSTGISNLEGINQS